MNYMYNYEPLENSLQKAYEETQAIQYLMTMRYDAGLSLSSEEMIELNKRYNKAYIRWLKLDELYDLFLDKDYQQDDPFD